MELEMNTHTHTHTHTKIKINQRQIIKRAHAFCGAIATGSNFVLKITQRNIMISDKQHNA